MTAVVNICVDRGVEINFRDDRGRHFRQPGRGNFLYHRDGGTIVFCGNSCLITRPPTGLTYLLGTYISTLTFLFYKHAPLMTTSVRVEHSQPWITSALSKLKSARRHLAKVSLRTSKVPSWMSSN